MEVLSAISEIILEEWNGPSSTRLSRTASITSSPSLSIQRSGNRFHHVWRRILQAFVPEGSNLNSNAKMWRLVADLMNDLGMLMDLVSPLFPSAFVFVVCRRVYQVASKRIERENSQSHNQSSELRSENYLISLKGHLNRFVLGYQRQLEMKP